MMKSTDVIIVGGGVIGSLIAYYLHDYGIRSTIVERDGIGSQASGGAAGLFNPIMPSGTPEFFTEFAIESHKLHSRLAESLISETGVDYHYGPISVVRLAFSDNEIQEQINEYKRLESLSLNPRLLNGTDLFNYSEWLSPDVKSLLITDYEAQVEPYQLMIALAQSLEKRSCRLMTGDVIKILTNNTGSNGIKLKNGNVLYADRVVLANGPWINSFSTCIGSNLPIKPIRGQILKLRTPIKLPPYWISYGKGYIAPKLAGHVIAGTTEEDVGFFRETTEEASLSIMNSVLKISPVMHDATLLEATACLRPVSSKDNLPFLGTIPHIPNLYIAAGHGKKGILLSAATGKYMAQLIATGTVDWDLAPYSIQRLNSP